MALIASDCLLMDLIRSPAISRRSTSQVIRASMLDGSPYLLHDL